MEKFDMKFPITGRYWLQFFAEIVVFSMVGCGAHLGEGTMVGDRLEQDPGSRRGDNLNKQAYFCRDLPSIGLSGYCIYEHSLCIDSRNNGQLVVIDGTKERGSPLVSQAAQGTGQYNGLYVAVQTQRIGASIGLPFRSFLHGRFESPAFLNNVEEIQWIPGYSVVAGFDSDSHNVYHFASKIMVAWYLHQRHLEASMEEELNPKCSMFENVILNRTQSGLGEWQKNLLHLVLGTEDCAEFTFASESDRNFKGVFGDHTVCFEKAYVLGTDNSLFVGPEDAWKLLMKVATNFHTSPIVPFLGGDIIYVKRSKPPHRRATNEDQVLHAIRQVTNRTVSVVNLEEMGFAEQVATMMKTAILFAPHGAGLTNIMFMPPGAAVVEMNPYYFAFDLYHHVAVASGHFYWRYSANRQETVPNDVIKEYYSGFSTRACMDNNCQPWARDLDFHVDIPTFTRLVQTVADTVLFST